MADRVSASITIGGRLPSTLIEDFITAITTECLSLEYDGERFDAAQLVSGEPLTLCANEVTSGEFDTLEAFCRAHKLAYARWYGCCVGAWGSGRAVYRGEVEPREGEDGVDEYDASDDDQILLGEQRARHLGSYAAIIEHFEAANFRVPLLEIVEPTASPQTAATAAPT